MFIFTNNTDYPNGIKFNDIDELIEYLDSYHVSEPGDQYWSEIIDEDGGRLCETGLRGKRCNCGVCLGAE